MKNNDAVVSGREEGKLLDPATVRRLSVLRPALSIFHLSLEWGAILAIGWLTWRNWSPALYVLAVVLIGARQHSLIVLMHEGAHRRLLPGRFLNDAVAEVLTAFPFFLFTMRDYRRNHFRHHYHLNTSGDPDWARKRGPSWQFPMSRGALARMLLRDVVGWGFLQFLIATLKLPQRKPGEGWFSLARIGFVAVVVVGVVKLNLVAPFLLLWVVPMMTWMQLAFHVRSIAEHFAIDARLPALAHTRTVLVHPLERMLFGCKNVNYHLEHHLYPSVPFYNLPALHKALMQQEVYRSGAPITRGYIGVFQECVRVDTAGRVLST